MSVIDSLSLGGTTYSLRDNDGRAIIAGTESSTTSAHAYSAGDYFILNDTLYEATAAIAVGGTITVGTNCQATTVCGEVGELKSEITALETQTTETVNLSEYVSGARGSSGVIGANSKRCTTAKTVYLRPGDTIAVSDIDPGYRIAVAGVTGGAYIVDSGWKTANYTYTVADGKAGTYYVNISESGGTSDIDPANLSTLTVTATVILQNRMTNMDDETADIRAVLGDYPSTTLNHTWVIGGIKVAGTNDSTTKRLRLTDYTLNVSIGTVISCDDIIDINVYEYSVDNTELLTYSGWTRKYATQNNAIIRIAVRLDSDHDHVMTSADLAEYPKHVYVGDSTGLVAKVERLESGEPDIASYYKTEGDATVQSVLGILTEPCLVFPLITDIHYQSDAPQIIDKSVENMRYVLESIPADFILNLGDNSDGDHGDGTVTLKRADYVRDRLMSLGLPVYQAIGNHDTNYESSGTILTLPQCYRTYISAARDVTFNLATNGTDYYIDFTNLGVRLVVVNANYLAQYTFSQDTADWLEQDALDTNNTVIFCAHQSSINTQNYNAQSSTNGSDITDALAAFVTGGGKLIQLVGHGHADYSFASPWLAIASCCNKAEKADLTKAGYQAITGYDSLGLVAPDRISDTASMDCWSVVVVRPFTRKINLVRFGAGSDREYSY